MNFNDPSYLAIIETIVTLEIQAGMSILIIDATEFTTRDESLSYDEKYLRLLRCPNQRMFLRERLLSKGCKFLDPRDVNANQIDPVLHQKVLEILDGNELNLSISSSIISQMRDELPEDSFMHNSLKI